VGRSAFRDENSIVFKLDRMARGAVPRSGESQTDVRDLIRILEGSYEGNTVILSDVSRYDNAHSIRLD
jgi:hypothetical protein